MRVILVSVAPSDPRQYAHFSLGRLSPNQGDSPWFWNIPIALLQESHGVSQELDDLLFKSMPTHLHTIVGDRHDKPLGRLESPLLDSKQVARSIVLGATWQQLKARLESRLKIAYDLEGGAGYEMAQDYAGLWTQVYGPEHHAELRRQRPTDLLYRSLTWARVKDVQAAEFRNVA